jgi:hypothetical protein
MQEVWRPVVGYEGLYSVSDQGRVRSEDRVVRHGHQLKGRPLSAAPDSYGYLKVAVWKNNVQRSVRIHSLVADAFLGPQPPKLVVCHGTGGHLDNSLGNLSYGSRKKNAQDMLRDGTALTGTKAPMAKLTEKDVREIRGSSESGVALARRYGVATAQISRIRTRKNWAWLDAG